VLKTVKMRQPAYYSTHCDSFFWLDQRAPLAFHTGSLAIFSFHTGPRALFAFHTGPRALFAFHTGSLAVVASTPTIGLRVISKPQKRLNSTDFRQLAVNIVYAHTVPSQESDFVVHFLARVPCIII
jgi:hypothetical protein